MVVRYEQPRQLAETHGLRLRGCCEAGVYRPLSLINGDGIAAVGEGGTHEGSIDALFVSKRLDQTQGVRK